MLYTIENEFLSASADEQGGELHSIKYGNTEILWQGDPKWWAFHAPVLFPFVGRLKDDLFFHNGKQYSLPLNHGFARRNKFTCKEHSKNEVVFSLCDTEETRNVYPFEFELLVMYKLTGKSLETNFKIINKGDDDMYFSIGGHPAFNCPFSADETLEDYEIVFNEKETAGTHLITDEGLVSDKTVPFFDNTNLIPLNNELFDKYQTLVFSKLKSTQAILRSTKTGKDVKLDFIGFPYFAIWQPPRAPFICFEPWLGVDDSPSASGKVSEKRGIIRLGSKEEYSCGYVIVVSC